LQLYLRASANSGRIAGENGEIQNGLEFLAINADSAGQYEEGFSANSLTKIHQQSHS